MICEFLFHFLFLLCT